MTAPSPQCQPNRQELRQDCTPEELAKWADEAQACIDSGEVIIADYGKALATVMVLRSHASLKARAEQAESKVDVLEKNAREQAKLLADTGRRVGELEGVLLPFAKTGWMTSDIEHTDRTVVAHMHPEREYEIILSSENFKRARDLLAALPKQEPGS